MVDVRRGDIWWAELGDPQQEGLPAFRRPVVVVQSNDLNESAIPTVVVVHCTTNLERAGIPVNVRLRKGPLPRASVANVAQPYLLSKSRLRERAGRARPDELQAIDAGLRRVLAL